MKLVYFIQSISKHTNCSSQHINQTVKSNKQTNELAYKKWVTSFTPTEINKANKARTQLNKLLMKPGKNAPYKLIKDERRPKNPIPALFLFNKDRWASGDFRGLDVGAATRLVSAEWDALSAAEKKVSQALTLERILKYYIC